MFQRIIKLAGVTFRDAQSNIRTFGCEDIGSYALVREPDNPHDPNAIRVALGGILFLGYVPKEIAKELAPVMDQGRQFIAFFVSRNEHPFHGTVGLTVRIEEYPCQEAA
jgi:HIRAN domain